MRFLLFLLSALVSLSSFAGKGVENATVHYVYQLDSDPTIYEFGSSTSNACGSHLYRVKSSSETVANRKFSLTLTAFTAGKKLAFHDTEQCEGDRSVVGWVKLTN